MNFKSLAKLILILTIASLFFRVGGFINPIGLNLSDIFLIISLIFTSIVIIRKETSIKINKNIMLFIILVVISVFIGTATSLITFGDLPWGKIVLDYLRLLSSLALFIIIVFWGIEDKIFLNQLGIAFLSSIIIIPFLYLTKILPGLVSEVSSRFMGFLDDPNYYSNFMIIPTTITAGLLFKNQKVIKRVLLFIILSFLIGSIVWSGSRGGFLGLSIALIILAVRTIKVSSRKIKTSFVIILTLILAFLMRILLLPSNAKNDISTRIARITTRPEVSDEITSPAIFISKDIPFTGNQNKLEIWKQALNYIVQNPLGYGTTYQKLINIKSRGKDHRVAHNIILEILLTGGILLFLLMSYLFIYFIKIVSQFFRKETLSPLGFTLFSALSGVVISSFFLDSLNLKWLWALSAILIATGIREGYNFTLLRNDTTSRTDRQSFPKCGSSSIN